MFNSASTSNETMRQHDMPLTVLQINGHGAGVRMVALVQLVETPWGLQGAAQQIAALFPKGQRG
jgi:hypothetical protein